MLSTLAAYFKLIRPANILTAMADIFAGFAVAIATLAAISPQPYFLLIKDNSLSLLYLLIATIGLYGGGIIFNDVCDADLDLIERPERLIPSGKITRKKATIVGVIFFAVSLFAAYQVSWLSFALAAIICSLCLLYDGITKHYAWLGPINMGLCRAVNLSLGMSAIPIALTQFWFLAIIPLLFIMAITLISKGEVHGGNKHHLRLAVIVYLIILILFLTFSYYRILNFFNILPFLVLFYGLILPPLIFAIKNLNAQSIRRAVKAGILSLIVLDTVIVSGFTHWVYGLVVLLLLPVSILMSKKFSVT